MQTDKTNSSQVQSRFWIDYCLIVVPIEALSECMSNASYSEKRSGPAAIDTLHTLIKDNSEVYPAFVAQDVRALR